MSRPGNWDDPDERVAVGAKVDQARQEYADMLETLIAVSRRNTDRDDPLAMPAIAYTVDKGLRKMFPDDESTQLWYANNMLAEAVLRLAHPRSDLNTPTEGETP